MMSKQEKFNDARAHIVRDIVVRYYLERDANLGSFNIAAIKDLCFNAVNLFEHIMEEMDKKSS
jgi:succinate dehydrogenase flavin-adding protein (antitoxin of CptAB toxin-antitoxin module)